MEYRKLNESYQPSLLGFGCMRFPLDAQGNIDEAEAERMLDTAIASGVNYIDTAFPYHHGDSEPFVGRVLKKYDRSSYYLTTKLPLWDIKTRMMLRKCLKSSYSAWGLIMWTFICCTLWIRKNGIKQESLVLSAIVKN